MDSWRETLSVLLVSQMDLEEAINDLASMAEYLQEEDKAVRSAESTHRATIKS